MNNPQRRVKFGWIASAGPHRETAGVPGLIGQQREVLPAVNKHFDSLWIFDHLLGFGDLDNPFLESWTALTWLAAEYTDLLVGHLVMAASFRNPALVAKMGATLQALSGGRFVLGIGAGWRVEEYKAYGYDYPTDGVRIAQLEEAVQIIRRMWTEPAPTMQGQYFHIEEGHCSPRPDPVPPIMIGGVGEKKMIPLIARHADWWSVPPTRLEDYTRKLALLRNELEKAKRKPSDIELTYSIYNAKLPTTKDESAAWLERIKPFIDLGVSHFMIDFGHVTDPSLVERFAGEVIEPAAG